jgi:DNA-directed RNA polymerase subunit omega
MGEVSAATATEQLQFPRLVCAESLDAAADSVSLSMKTHLLIAASEIIPDKNLLINVISRRVRQLSFGHRPLVACLPGTGFADVALTEVIEKKLTYESTLVPKEPEQLARVVPFPKAISRAKAA